MTSAHKERTIRTHVVLPEKLVREIDARVGPRKRSEYIAGLVESELRRQARMDALERLQATFSPEKYPHWATEEAADKWLREVKKDRRDPWAE